MIKSPYIRQVLMLLLSLVIVTSIGILASSQPDSDDSSPQAGEAYD